MAKKQAAAVPQAKLDLYEKLVVAFPEVERKGAAMPYTSCNGHMFSFLTKDGKLALRLPDEPREAFIKKFKTKLCEQHGTVMKEYVVVPDTLLKKTAELKKHFRASLDYVSSLKPKATTRKKKQTKKVAKKTSSSAKGRKKKVGKKK